MPPSQAEQLIIPGVPEKLVRPRGIGSSQVGTLLGLNPYSRPRDLWEELTGRAPPFEGNWDTRLGQAVELPLAEEYMRRTGRVLVKGATVQHPTLPFVFATPDFLWLEIGVPAGIVEIKNCRFKAKRGGEKDMRPAYEVQVRLQLACRQLPRGDLFIHCMSKGRDDAEQFEVIPVERNVDLEQRMLTVCERFWRFVESDTPPPDTFPLEAA